MIEKAKEIQALLEKAQSIKGLERLPESKKLYLQAIKELVELLETDRKCGHELCNFKKDLVIAGSLEQVAKTYAELSGMQAVLASIAELAPPENDVPF